jgi:hypothetical protein
VVLDLLVIELRLDVVKDYSQMGADFPMGSLLVNVGRNSFFGWWRWIPVHSEMRTDRLLSKRKDP